MAIRPKQTLFRLLVISNYFSLDVGCVHSWTFIQRSAVSFHKCGQGVLDWMLDRPRHDPGNSSRLSWDDVL